MEFPKLCRFIGRCVGARCAPLLEGSASWARWEWSSVGLSERSESRLGSLLETTPDLRRYRKKFSCCRHPLSGATSRRLSSRSGQQTLCTKAHVEFRCSVAAVGARRHVMNPVRWAPLKAAKNRVQGGERRTAYDAGWHQGGRTARRKLGAVSRASHQLQPRALRVVAGLRGRSALEGVAFRASRPATAMAARPEGCPSLERGRGSAPRHQRRGDGLPKARG